VYLYHPLSCAGLFNPIVRFAVGTNAVLTAIFGSSEFGFYTFRDEDIFILIDGADSKNHAFAFCTAE
jgi:hypothetical protein